MPDLTLLVNMSIPLGPDNKTAGDVVPDARLAYGWALTEKLRVYGVGTIAAGVNDSGHYPQAAGSAGLSYAIPIESARLSSMMVFSRAGKTKTVPTMRMAASQSC